MLGAFSRDFRVCLGLLILLMLTSLTVVGQATSGQASVAQASPDPLLGQPSARPSSAATTAATLPADESSSGQSSSEQSLADIARANQENKAAEGSTTPRMITNADLPKNPEGYTGPPADEEQRPARSWGNTSREAAQQRAAEHASAVWRQQIVAQRNRIVMLETRIDRLRAQIRFADPNAAGDYSAGTSYNGAQGTQIRILKDMEAELGQQTQRLEEMQDAARRAGMHTTVYDP